MVYMALLRCTRNNFVAIWHCLLKVSTASSGLEQCGRWQISKREWTARRQEQLASRRRRLPSSRSPRCLSCGRRARRRQCAPTTTTMKAVTETRGGSRCRSSTRYQSSTRYRSTSTARCTASPSRGRRTGAVRKTSRTIARQLPYQSTKIFFIYVCRIARKTEATLLEYSHH